MLQITQKVWTLHTQLLLSCYLHVAIIYVPVALLEEFQFWKVCVSTGVPFSFIFFTGTALTLRTSTLSVPCGSGVSKIMVIVTIESFKGEKLFASTCFIWLEAPSPLPMVMLYQSVGNEGQSGDTWGQEAGEVTCTHGNTDHVSPLATFNCMCTWKQHYVCTHTYFFNCNVSHCGWHKGDIADIECTWSYKQITQYNILFIP